MGRVKSWIMDLEELAYEGYSQELRDEELKAYIKARAPNYDAGYVEQFIENIEDD